MEKIDSFCQSVSSPSNATRSITRGPRSALSQDSRLAILPVAIAQQALVQLAGWQARELGFEVDRARALVVGKMFSAVLDELAFEDGSGVDTVHHLHDRFHLFAEVFVGNPEH